MASPGKRREMDVMKLSESHHINPSQVSKCLSMFDTALTPALFPFTVMTDYKVELIEDNICEMNVHFHGPKDSTLFFYHNYPPTL